MSIKHEKTPKSRNIVNKVSFAFFGGPSVSNFSELTYVYALFWTGNILVVEAVFLPFSLVRNTLPPPGGQVGRVEGVGWAGWLGGLGGWVAGW